LVPAAMSFFKMSPERSQNMPSVGYLVDTE